MIVSQVLAATALHFDQAAYLAALDRAHARSYHSYFNQYVLTDDEAGFIAVDEGDYRDRSLDTRVGTLNLKIPKLRAGSYFPGFLEPRKMVEKALVAVIQEAWIGGVSTRRVDELVQAMGMTGISKSTVSKLCKDIDERVLAFLKRPLTGEWPYLWLDATYLKVREGGRIISVAAIIAMAVNTEGRREIVGLHIGPSEAEVLRHHDQGLWVHASQRSCLCRKGRKGERACGRYFGILDPHRTSPSQPQARKGCLPFGLFAPAWAKGHGCTHTTPHCGRLHGCSAR